MRSDSPPFSHAFPDSISAMSNPGPRPLQQPHMSPSTSSLMPYLSNKGPFNSLGRRYHSGLVSPSIFLAELNDSPSSLHPSEVAFIRPIHPFAQDMSNVFQPNVSKLRDIESIISPHPLLKPLLETSLGRLVKDLFQEPIYDIERSPEVEEKRRESCLKLDGEVLALGCTIYYDDTCSSKKAFEEVLNCLLQVHSHSNEIVIRSNTKRHFSVLEAVGCTNDGRALTVAGAWKLTKAGTVEEVERLRKAVRLELECQQEWRVFGREVASSLFSSPDDNSCRRIGHCAGSATTTSGANYRVRSFYYDIFNGRSAAEMLNNDECLVERRIDRGFLVKGRFGNPILIIVESLTIYKGGLATHCYCWKVVDPGQSVY